MTGCLFCLRTLLLDEIFIRVQAAVQVALQHIQKVSSIPSSTISCCCIIIVQTIHILNHAIHILIARRTVVCPISGTDATGSVKLVLRVLISLHKFSILLRVGIVLHIAKQKRQVIQIPCLTIHILRKIGAITAHQIILPTIGNPSGIRAVGSQASIIFVFQELITRQQPPPRCEKRVAAVVVRQAKPVQFSIYIIQRHRCPVCPLRTDAVIERLGILLRTALPSSTVFRRLLQRILEIIVSCYIVLHRIRSIPIVERAGRRILNAVSLQVCLHRLLGHRIVCVSRQNCSCASIFLSNSNCPITPSHTILLSCSTVVVVPCRTGTVHCCATFVPCIALIPAVSTRWRISRTAKAIPCFTAVIRDTAGIASATVFNNRHILTLSTKNSTHHPVSA